MKSIYVDLEIASAAAPSAASRTVHALVDTGAILSVFPASLLDDLGVARRARRRFHGFGGPVVRETGGAVIRYQDSVAGVTVIFGAEGDPAIMGGTALESLGYQVDPVAGRLNRVDMLML